MMMTPIVSSSPLFSPRHTDFPIFLTMILHHSQLISRSYHKIVIENVHSNMAWLVIC